MERNDGWRVVGSSRTATEAGRRHIAMTRVLLVEDHEEIWDFLSRRLKRRGYDVVLATDGQQAVDKARTEPGCCDRMNAAERSDEHRLPVRVPPA